MKIVESDPTTYGKLMVDSKHFQDYIINLYHEMNSSLDIEKDEFETTDQFMQRKKRTAVKRNKKLLFGCGGRVSLFEALVHESIAVLTLHRWTSTL